MIDRQMKFSASDIIRKIIFLVCLLMISNQSFAGSVSDIPVHYFSQHGDICDSCSKNKTSIRYLQVVLNSDSQLSLSPKLLEDGVWGSNTKNAVKDFQRKYNLSPVDGWVGTSSKAKLDVVLARSKLEPVTKPRAPSKPTASETLSDKIRITWSSVPLANNYRIYRTRSSASWDKGTLLTAPRSSLSYDDTSADVGVNYYYSLKACNNSLCSDNYSPSDLGFRTASSPSKPSTPSKPYASDGTYANKVVITWSKVPDVDEYQVYRSTRSSSYGNPLPISLSGSASSVIDGGAIAGTNYYYRVRACKRGTCSNFSAYDVGYRKTISSDFRMINPGTDVPYFNLRQKRKYKALLYVAYPLILAQQSVLVLNLEQSVDSYTEADEGAEALRKKISYATLAMGVVADNNRNDYQNAAKRVLKEAFIEGAGNVYNPETVNILSDIYSTMEIGKECKKVDVVDCVLGGVDIVGNTGVNLARLVNLLHFSWTSSNYIEKLNAYQVAEAYIHDSIKKDNFFEITESRLDYYASKIGYAESGWGGFWTNRDYDVQVAIEMANLYKNLILSSYSNTVLSNITLDPVSNPQNNKPSVSSLNIDGGLVNVSQTPTLRASGFSDPDVSHIHTKTWWGIREYGKRNYIFDSDWSTSNKYSIRINASAGLQKGRKYQAVVAFMDNHGAYSNARFVTFTTKADINPNNKPRTPTVEVNSGVNDVSLMPVLTTSNFSDLDTSDSHDATWWEIRKTGSVIWNSSWDKTNLTSITIPSGILDLETTYTVYVRHRDSRSAISGLGSVTFTTKSVIGTDNKPDLAVINVSVSNAFPIVGESIQLEADIKNIGSATATSTHTRYYVSTDSNITTSDTEVDSETTSSLDAGETDSEREAFSAPATSGTYWVGMCVDVVSDESNTTNNCSVGVRITVTGNTTDNKPDWVLINPSVSKANLQTGERIRFTVILKNQGTSKADNSQINFYISHDSIIGTDDELKRSEQSTRLDPGEQDPLNKGIDAPDTKGTYWVGACIDAVSNESDTTNNCSSGVRIEVEESIYSDDFSFERVSVDKTIVEAGGSLALYAKEEYNGTRTANRVENTIAYLLKSQNDSSIPEVYLADDIGVPSNGSTSGKRETVTIPINTKAGLYFIVFIADYPNEYVETNENNNTAQVAIEVVENTSVFFNLDIDGDGEVKPLTDGLLNLRYQFGFRGNTLIDGAVATGASRKTAGQIETYLIEGGLALDIDGDGEIKPLTDGLLTLRYLFGFRDDTLINNAVDENATRKTSQAIENKIQTLVQ